MKREFAFVIDAERYLEAKGYSLIRHAIRPMGHGYSDWANKTGQRAILRVEMVHASSYKVNVTIY